MTLDLSEVKKIAVNCGADFDPVEIIFHLPQLQSFAQACYAMGAAEQKEKDAKICLNEYVDAIATNEPTDHAYNRALDDAAEAIRSQS